MQLPETLCFRLVSLWEWVCPVVSRLFYTSQQEAGWAHREQQCQAKLLFPTTLLPAEPVFASGTFPRITLNPSTPGTMTPTDSHVPRSHWTPGLFRRITFIYLSTPLLTYYCVFDFAQVHRPRSTSEGQRTTPESILSFHFLRWVPGLNSVVRSGPPSQAPKASSCISRILPLFINTIMTLGEFCPF